MKRMGFSAGIVACLMLAGCGGGSDDSGGGTTPPPPPPPPSGIGSAGGTVTEASGAKVIIPSGALAANTDIKVTQTATGAPALPAGVTAFGQIYAFTPHGTSFSKAVTITVPFNPASVPAGTSVALYKTDGALTTWTEVPNATVTGNTISGDVTGFSDAVAGSKGTVTQITPTLKHWDVDVYNQKSNRIRLTSGDKTGEAVDLKEFLTVPPLDLPDWWVFSNQSGRTFWTQSIAPTGGGPFIGTRTTLTQTFYFKALKDAPTLHFLITHATLKMFDGGGVIASRPACPWLDHDPDGQDALLRCDAFITRAEAAFRIEAHSLTTNPMFFRAGGSAEVTGLMRDWRPLVTGDATEHPIFHESDFFFDEDPEGDGTGRAFEGSLKAPVPVEIPISSLHKDDIFEVQITLKTTAIDHIQGESFIGALLQDPLNNVGVDLQTDGLEQLPQQPDVPASPAVLTCPSPNPAAGSIGFTQAEFLEPERSESALIYVDRVGGTTGEVSVHVQTSDGAAVGGSDYQPTSIEVRFADGDSTRRRIEIPLVNDDVAEPDKDLHVSLSAVGGCASLGALQNAIVKILDDDRPIPVTPTFTLGGTVTGLQGSGLHLQTNFINDVSPAADGAFTFPRELDDGTAYAVTIVTQPSNPAQVCTLSNGSGTIAGANVTNVGVSCTTPPPPSGLDAGFGTGGKVFSTSGSARVLKLQTDGKLLALGNLTLNRYNADGTPDTTFGTAGKIDIVTGGAAIDKMMALTVQSDGKILVVGNTQLPTVPGIDFITLRYNADGTPDTTFGGGTGLVKTDFDGARDEATGVFVQDSGGNIVVTGDVQIHKTVNQGGIVVDIVDQDYGAARYLPDGTLDTTFGTAGKASVDVGGLDTANAVSQAFNDSFLIVGRVQISGGTGNPDMGIVKFFSDGRIDTGFGNGGTERIDASGGVVPGSFNGGDTDEALDVTVQKDGKILLAGYNFVLVNNQFVSVAAMFRLTETGAIEHNFQASIPTQINRVNGVAVRTSNLKGEGDISIVIAGTTATDFGLAQFDMNGALDTSFGDSGLLAVDFFGGTDAAQDVLVQPDGKIVAGGSAKNGTGGGAGLVRVNP